MPCDESWIKDVMSSGRRLKNQTHGSMYADSGPIGRLLLLKISRPALMSPGRTF